MGPYTSRHEVISHMRHRNARSGSPIYFYPSTFLKLLKSTSTSKLHESCDIFLKFKIQIDVFMLLCFAIGLTVDSGKAFDDDGASSQVSWLQGSVLSTGSFSVVLISNHHPVHSVGLD